MSLASRSRSAERGESLVEVLVTIAIVSIAFVAILSALAVTIRSSRTHEISAATNTVLVAAAEAVKAAEFCDTFDPAVCPDAAAYYENELADVDLPSGWATVSFVVTVAADSGAARTLQDVTVQVTSPDGDATRSVTVAKLAPPPPEPPPPPPTAGACTVDAHAFWLLFFIFVDVDVTSNPDDCAPPIRAQIVGSGAANTLGQESPTVWTGYLFSLGGPCTLPFCQIDILDANGLVTTVPVELFG